MPQVAAVGTLPRTAEDDSFADGGGRSGRVGRRTEGQATWRVSLVLAGAALVATLTNAPGVYIGDNRFELYWATGQRAAKTLSLWDAGRGLGRVREDFWPGATAAVGLLRAMGAPPALAEHLFHALLLAVAGAGMVMVLRVFRPRVSATHAVAGLLYMFNPYTSTFLIPSGLFLNYALAPWLLVTFARGITGPRSWRWPAAFALLVFASGTIDVPGLIFAACWLVPTGAYLVAVERAATWRDVSSWLGRSLLLTALVSMAALAKLWFGAAVFSGRLASTESPDSLNLVSSWAESWRGLGFWVSYIRDPLGGPRPQGGFFYESWLGVLVTFALPIAALLTIWRTRWRPRVLFGALMLCSLALMVGAYPPRATSIFGHALLAGYEHVPGLAIMRNSYKAGSGLGMAQAALVAVGAAHLARWLATLTAWPRRLALALAVVLVLASSFPFWTGKLYSPTAQIERMPTYWRTASRWLEDHAGDARVLVLPGATKAAYRWGFAGDDILDSLLPRSNVVSTAVPLSGFETASVVDAITQRIESGRYETGMLAPILRRLGIEFVLIRNDLDWERTGAARPNTLAPVREDPDLTRVAFFGNRGQNVVGLGDASDDAIAEVALPPVEVYAVRGPGPLVPALQPDGAVLVAGDGEAWPALASSGRLDDRRPVRFVGDLTPSELGEELESGSSLVITDTNRRRVTVVRGDSIDTSYTLPAGGRLLGRAPRSLFDGAGEETVAVHPDASSITSSGFGTSLAGYQNWARPANAFDGDPATAWLVAGLDRADGAWIKVDFARSETVGRVVLTAHRPVGNPRRVESATIRFSDGTEVPVSFADNKTRDLSFGARETSSIEVLVDSTTGSGLAAVGFDEIDIPGLDLAEVVATPDGIADAARADARLRDALVAAPVTYQLERLIGDGPQAEEPQLRRRIAVVGDRGFAVSATVRATVDTPESTIDRLLGGDVGAAGTSRFHGALASTGRAAVDGDPETAWGVRPRLGEALHVRFPSQVVTRVVVTAPATGSTSVLRAVRVTVGDDVVPLDLAEQGSCEPGAADVGEPCRTIGIALVRAQVASSLDLEITSIDERADPEGELLPLEVAEVDWGGAPATSGSVACEPNELLTVDGRDVALRPMQAPVALLTGEDLLYRSCRTLPVEEGDHTVVAARDVAVDRVLLTAGRMAPSTASEPSVLQLARGATNVDVLVRSSGGALVTSGQSYDPGWRATIDGRDAGPPLAVDTMSAWRVPAGDVHVEMRYGPQPFFQWTLVVSGTAVVACGVVVWRGSRRSRTEWSRADEAMARRTSGATAGSPRRRRLMPAGAAVAAVVIGMGIGGVQGAIVAAAAVAATRRRPGDAAAAAAVVMLVVAALASVLQAPPTFDSLRPSFALQRDIGATAALAAGVLTVVAVIGYGVRGRATASALQPGHPQADSEPATGPRADP